MGLRTRLVAATLLVVASVVVGVVIVRVTGSPEVTMASSSQQTAHAADLAAPGVDGEWRSDGQARGAWLEQSWRGPVDVRRVVIERGETGAEITAGYLRFSDGSRLAVTLTGQTTVVPVRERSSSFLRFTVSEVADGAGDDASVSVREVRADSEDGPGGPVSTEITGTGDVAGSASLGGGTPELVDEDVETESPVDDVVELAWDDPQELASVSIAGSAQGRTRIERATLEFSDGSTVPVGEVVNDPTRPTVVGFMPRATSSLRLLVDRVAGDRPLALAELTASRTGATPATPSLAGDGTVDRVAAAECSPLADRPDDELGVVVVCPTNGTVIEGRRVRVDVAAGPAYSTASAEVWSAEPGSPSGARVSEDLDQDGRASLRLDVSALPPGPFVVALRARGDAVRTNALDSERGVTPTYLQLAKPGELPSSEDDAPEGRSLVYADDFDTPLSITRSGEGANYAAAKPTSGGVEDFGAAIFADPELGLGNVGHRDGYLRLRVTPRPADFADPQRFGRDHLGGMLASARPGGSGVSAQYGYFEARMLVPSAPGTWPAFWLLTNPDLVEPEPVVAEIDALEHYGHNAVGACQTSHQYPDPDEVGVALCGQRWETPREALEWHTFGVDVRPDGIVYYIDGAPVDEVPQVEAGDQPMFFMLDLALGGGWPIELAGVRDRADLYVDWVRVWV